MTSNPGTVGFVGLGNMGEPMSRRLVEAGYKVVGHDLSAEARRRAAAHGVEETTDLFGLTSAGCDLIILMLPSSQVVAGVLGDETFLKRIDAGTLIVDMSSSEPLLTRALSESLWHLGVKMIDAPVSGGVTGAMKGTLTVMAGGDAADVENARGCLETFGRVIHAGPIGAGHALKALNNLLSATHLWVTSEAMLAGERFGIDPEVMLSVFNTSSGRSGSTENKWPNFILPGNFNSGFGLRLMVKDMGIAVQLAEQVGVPSVLGSDALYLWSQAAADLPPNADHTEIARWLEKETKPHDH
jgi:3-hydroxyisobutyrate dehydrogenase